MNKRFTPKETLQNYFDELLNEDLTANPQASLATFAESFFTEARFADPDSERQEKLTRLLQTTHSRLSTETQLATPSQVTLVAPVVIPAVVDDEIQTWEIETVNEVPALLEPEVETPEMVSDETIPAFQMEGVEWLDNGRPAWAQTRFDVLLFQVSGLTLAVPLISLGQIQPITEELTPLFGQADWFMGLQPTAAGKIRTVNTAKFVMPERYDPRFVETAKYVVSINGVPWGLAVDSVNQPISLEPEDVKWRGERSKRPWLAGTVKAQMCALLDIPRIGQLLMDADRNSGKRAVHR